MQLGIPHACQSMERSTVLERRDAEILFGHARKSLCHDQSHPIVSANVWPCRGDGPCHGHYFVRGLCVCPEPVLLGPRVPDKTMDAIALRTNVPAVWHYGHEQ